MLTLRLAETVTPWDVVPFLQASPTTAGGGMLRDEHWMAAVRGLFAVAGRVLGCKTCVDEPTRMLQDRRQSPVFQISPLSLTEVESLPERRSRQSGKYLVE
jgi:hypothetical protein